MEAQEGPTLNKPGVYRVFVGGFPPEIKEEEVVSLFKPFGSVKNVELIRFNDRHVHPAGKCRGFGYVTVDAPNGLAKCFSTYNHTTWKGRKLRIELPKDNHEEKMKKEQEQILLEAQQVEEDMKKLSEKTLFNMKKDDLTAEEERLGRDPRLLVMYSLSGKRIKIPIKGKPGARRKFADDETDNGPSQSKGKKDSIVPNQETQGKGTNKAGYNHLSKPNDRYGDGQTKAKYEPEQDGYDHDEDYADYDEEYDYEEVEEEVYENESTHQQDGDVDDDDDDDDDDDESDEVQKKADKPKK